MRLENMEVNIEKTEVNIGQMVTEVLLYSYVTLKMRTKTSICRHMNG